LIARHAVYERDELGARRLETRSCIGFRLHARAQVENNNQITRRRTKMQQRRLGERGNERRRRQELQDKQKVFL
jgi:hypothetical protein